MCGLEHLSNCHGEWGIIAGGLFALSSVGLWLRLKYRSTRYGVRMWFANRKVKKLPQQ